MQISDNKEKGVKLTLQHISDITSIPLKKRPLVWIQSSSPPLLPSSPTKEINDTMVSQACPTKECKYTQLEHSLPDSGFLVSDFGSQKISTGTGNYEPPNIMSVSLESSHSFRNQGPNPVVDTASHVDSSCTGSVSSDTTFSQLTARKLALISNANEQSEKAFLDGAEERVSSYKSALQSVLGTVNLSSLKEPQGLPPEANPCKGHLKQEKNVCVSKVDPDVQGMITEVEKSNNLKRIIAKRLDWDLNTTMDTWVGSLCNEGKNHAESGTLAAGEHRKINQETCSESMINKIGETIVKHAESDKFFKLNDLSPSLYCTDANTNLHLSPCSKTPLHLTKRINGGSLADFSLTRKPSHIICKSVNTLPYEMNDHQKVTMKLVKSGKNTVFDKVVKSEPCEEFPNELLGFCQNNNHYSSLPMKSEPKEVGYPTKFKSDEESVHHNESSTSYIKPLVHRKVKENTHQSDAKVSQSSLVHGNLACDLQLRTPSVDVFKDINVHVQSRLNLPGDGECNDAPSSETLLHEEDPLKENAIVGSEFAESEKDGKTIATFVSELRVLDGDVLNSLEKPSSDNLSYHLSDSAHINKTIEINRFNNTSLDVNTIGHPKQKPQNKHKLDNFHASDGVQMTLRETFLDPIMKDVVVGDKWQEACEALANEKETEHAEVYDEADSCVNAGFAMGISHFNGKEQAIQNPTEDVDIQLPECVASQCSKEILLHGLTDIQPSAVLTCETIEDANLTSNTPSLHLNRLKGTEIEVCSRNSCEKNSAINDDVHSEYVRHKIKVDDSKMPSEDLQIPSKSEKSNSVDNENFGRQFSSGEASHLNSAPANLSCDLTGDVPRKVILSQIEKQGFHVRAKEEELLGTRSGGRQESRIYGKERKQDGYIRKSGYDFSVQHGRFDQKLDILHGEQDCSDYSFEPFNSSDRFQHNRPKIASEASFPDDADRSIKSANRSARKSVNDELENFSGQAPRRWPSRTRGHIPFDHQLAPKPMRGEEKFMRDFSNDTVDPSMLPNPRANYDRRDLYVRRGRRSFSPDSRRGPPNFSRTYSPYSTRPHMRSPRLWSPQRPDEFDGQPELIPQSLQFERVVLPIGADSFPEYISDRRVGSPPFVSRLHDGMREVGNLREYDDPRTGRHLQRNIRRFHLIDPRVNEEEQYFDTLHPDHLNEIIRDDEHVEGRNYDGCRGFVRPLSNRYYGGNGTGFRDNGRNFSHRIERGPSRPIRFRPDTEEFSHRENSRERCFRSGIVNASQRIRGLKEQENNYNADEVQGLQGPGFNDNPVKRRRF